MQMLVLLGPLGSGKTTLLRELMEQQRPTGKVLLVINDVGQVNIDASRLNDLGEMESMTAGCIGCSDLAAFLEVMERAKAAGVEHLIVEPTGIADGREVYDAAMEARLEMSSVALVDVQHFDRNRALGVMETQLSVAGMVGLTWCDQYLDHPDGVAQEALSTILDFCGAHAPGKSVSLVSSEPAAFVALLMQRYLSGTLQVGQSAPAKSHACGHDHSHHGHDHHHHHDGHHNHGVYAESGSLPSKLDRETVTALIAEMGASLVRAKGVVAGESFDFTQGSLRFGAPSSVEPNATFISSEPLGIIEQHTEINDTKKQLMRGYEAPIKATLAAIQWQQGEYPNNRSPNGEIRVDAEADIIRQLCERKGVSTSVRADAIQRYIDWRLESLCLLVNDGDRWQSHPEVSYWRRRLGAVLCWHAENVADVLRAAQIKEMVCLDVSRHALEGLLALSELSFDDEKAEERPELIGDCLSFAARHNQFDNELVTRVLQHCTALSADNPEWNKRWHDVSNQYLKAA